MKRYTLLYKGMSVFSSNFSNKLKTMGFEMAKQKGWDIKDLEIRDNVVQSSKA